jgi:hypothetical protein
MKTCTRCLIEKDLSEFSFRSSRPRSHCKQCASELSIESQNRRRELDPIAYKAYKSESKRKQVYRRYGISPSRIEELGEIQNWQCYICGENIYGRAYVDHNHKTSQIRKLLCFHCNVGLGHFKDSSVLLERAKLYLEEHDD